MEGRRLTPDQSELPVEVQRLWRLTAQQRMGRPPELDLDTIIAQAISIADAEGLDGISMARIADELGYSTMSLYRHVTDKDEMLTLMVDAAGPPPPEIEGSWREGLETFTRELRGLYRQRPWILGVPITRPPAGPRSLAWLESCLGALDGTGLEAEEKIGVAMLLMGHARTDAALQTDLRRGLAEGRDLGDIENYGRLLHQILDPEDFPHLIDVFSDQGTGTSETEGELDTGFEFGLRCILDGVASLIADRKG